MWTALIEKKERLKAIYRDKIPSLQNIELSKIVITNGGDLDCDLNFITTDIPSVMPTKWQQQGCNSVAIGFKLISVEILTLSTSGNDIFGHLTISKELDSIVVSFVSNTREMFKMKCKWIYLDYITGLVTE